MRFSALILCVILLVMPAALLGGYVNVGGRWSPEKYVPTLSVQEHYDQGFLAFNEKRWDGALIHFMVIIYHYKDSPFYADSLFYSGICYYEKSEVDIANKQFDLYLSLGGKLKNFEKVFDYKLGIANFYAQGVKKHLFGMERLPKWSPAKLDALLIYDEIIAALPGKEIAAEALYQKADLLRARIEYASSIDALQILSRRFPKHTLAAESFLRISEIYLEQSRRESQNPDFIALAQINIQRFAKCFPADRRIKIAKENLLAMKEVYAQSLYDTGRFYERKKKAHASIIYYEDTIQKFPETQAAQKSRERIAFLLTRAGANVT